MFHRQLISLLICGIIIESCKAKDSSNKSDLKVGPGEGAIELPKVKTVKAEVSVESNSEIPWGDEMADDVPFPEDPGTIYCQLRISGDPKKPGCSSVNFIQIVGLAVPRLNQLGLFCQNQLSKDNCTTNFVRSNANVDNVGDPGLLMHGDFCL